VVQCNRTTVDKVWKSTEVYEGVAKYLKTNQGNLASLEMKRKDNPAIYEKYVCSGTFVYEFAPGAKEIRVHELPRPASGQVVDDNFLSFLFGMKAADAKRRYQLTFVPPPANDKWYYYIEVRPRERQDMQDFTRARLVLMASNNLPRQLWFEQPNGNEVTWDFPQVTTGVDLRVQEFGQPQVPPGWQLKQAPGRVIRQQQP
jgi:TIGR03009 family protein